jgi:hypothetical protein
MTVETTFGFFFGRRFKMEDVEVRKECRVPLHAKTLLKRIDRASFALECLGNLLSKIQVEDQFLDKPERFSANSRLIGGLYDCITSLGWHAQMDICELHEVLGIEEGE